MKDYIILYDMNLYDKIKWFDLLFGEIVRKEEGWYVCTSYIAHHFVYNVCPVSYFEKRIDLNINANIKSDVNNIKSACEFYGFKFDKKFDVIDIDINQIKKNKHLITGNELGLL